MDDSCDGGERDGAEGNEPSKRAEGDRDHFGVFRRVADEYRAKEVFRVPAILLSNKNVSPSAGWRDHDARVQTKERKVPEAKLAVTRIGASDLSAA